MKNFNNKYLMLAGILVEDTLYSFTLTNNLLLTVNLKTGKIHLLNSAEDYDVSFTADSMWSIRDGDDIFVPELNGKRLLRYNLKEKKCHYYKIRCDGKQWDNCAAITKYKNKICIFPKYKEGVIKLDLSSGKIEKDKEIYSEIYSCGMRGKCGKEDKYFECGYQEGDILWLFQESGNFVIAYDIRNESWKKYRLPVEINHCIHVVMYNGLMYILSSEGRIFSWDVSGGTIEKIFDCSEEGENKDIYSRIAVTDKFIFLLPAFGQDIFKINIEMRKAEKYSAYPEEFFYYMPEIRSKYFGYCENDRFYYFLMRSANYILCINKQNGEEKWIKPQFPLVSEYMKVYMSYSKGTFNEGGWSREEMKRILENHIDKNSKKDVSEGERIWEQTKKRM